MARHVRTTSWLHPGEGEDCSVAASPLPSGQAAWSRWVRRQMEGTTYLSRFNADAKAGAGALYTLEQGVDLGERATDLMGAKAQTLAELAKSCL
jgi:hypothetical protein